MDDPSRTIQELTKEISVLKRRIRALEKKDGSIRPFEHTAGPPVDADGQIAGFGGVDRDITGRERAGEEKRRGRETIGRLAEEMAIIAEIGRLIGSTLNIDEVYEQFAAEVRKLIPFDRIHVNLKSPDGETFTIVYVSGLDIAGRRPGDKVPLAGSMSEVLFRTRTGLCLHPASEEEIVGRFPGASAVTTFRAGMRSIIAVPLISRNEVIGTLHFRAKQPNAYTEQDLRLAERIGSQIAGAIASAQLYSDLRETEKSLRENEKRFRTLVEHAAVGIAEVEAGTGRFLAVNRMLCEMLGRTEQEMLATTFMAITHPEDLNLHPSLSKRMYGGEFDHYSLEKRYLRKDGGVIWVNITISRLWKPGETPGRSITIVRDITERRRMEEELLRTHKLESLGVLAGGIAHDFNNLMGIVQGYIDLALMDLPPDHVSRQGLLTAIRSVEQTRDLTSRLITFSRGGGPHREIIDVAGLIRDAVHRTVRGAEVRVKFDFAGKLWPAEVDELQMKQCFYNLTTNAVEAMPEGGNLTIQAENTRIPSGEVLDLKEGPYLKITFADQGIGVPEEHLAKLFDPYFTTKTMASQQGLGLGLSVCYSVLKKHGGHITVNPQPGKGASFVLYLPARADLAG